MTRLKMIKEGEGASGGIHELSRLRPMVFAGFLLLDWAAILAGFFLFFYFRNVYSFLAGSILIGSGQHGLAVLGHEAVHYRICHNKRLNDFVGNLFCFMPLGLTVSCYRAYHLPHHRDPFGPGDPEVPLRRAIGKSFDPPFSLGRGLKLWALSYVGFSLKEMYFISTMLPRSEAKERVFLVAFWVVAVAALYPIIVSLLPLWFYSLATTYVSKLRIQAWFEHGLGETNTNRYSLPNPLYRFLVPHNIWVHYEHHKYPGVPFYNLEKLRAMESQPKIYSVREMCEALSRKPDFYEREAA